MAIRRAKFLPIWVRETLRDTDLGYEIISQSGERKTEPHKNRTARSEKDLTTGLSGSYVVSGTAAYRHKRGHSFAVADHNTFADFAVIVVQSDL